MGPNGLSIAPRAWSSANDLAFEGWDDAKPSRTGIYLSISNGGGQIWGDFRRLTSRPGPDHDVPVAFSPDSSHLLFVRKAEGDDGGGDLYVIGIDGTGLRRLNPPSTKVSFTDAFGPGASWSSDGTQVAFSAFDTGRTDGRPRSTSSERRRGARARSPIPARG